MRTQMIKRPDQCAACASEFEEEALVEIHAREIVLSRQADGTPNILREWVCPHGSPIDG